MNGILAAIHFADNNPFAFIKVFGLSICVYLEGVVAQVQDMKPTRPCDFPLSLFSFLGFSLILVVHDLLVLFHFSDRIGTYCLLRSKHLVLNQQLTHLTDFVMFGLLMTENLKCTVCTKTILIFFASV